MCESSSRHAIVGKSDTQIGNKMDTVWKSQLTDDMTKSLSEDEIALLITDLNDAVMATCEDWGI